MNVLLNSKLNKKKKKGKDRNSANSGKYNIPPTLLHDSSYRTANRSCSRTSNCTPPRAKIRNRRAAAEPWLDPRRWSPINRTRGGKSTSSRQPWPAWIPRHVPGCTVVATSSRWLIRVWCKPVFPLLRTRKTTISLDLPHGLDLRDFCALFNTPRGNFYGLVDGWWIEG